MRMAREGGRVKTTRSRTSERGVDREREADDKDGMRARAQRDGEEDNSAGGEKSRENAEPSWKVTVVLMILLNPCSM